MIALFTRGPVHLPAQVFRTGRQGLGLIERLGAHLTHMVDAHQRTGQPAILRCQFFATQRAGGIGACGVNRAAERAQRMVHTGQKSIDRAHACVEYATSHSTLHGSMTLLADNNQGAFEGQTLAFGEWVWCNTFSFHRGGWPDQPLTG